MRYAIIVLSLLFGSVIPANAQVSIGIGIGTPNMNIGINIPAYPNFARVPGYPVYYAPQASFNLFFYDGLYWAYQRDEWYASSWYNGPWGRVNPQYVPAYILRVPVGYYRSPPPYFHGWSKKAPPRWGQHYGQHWEQERHGWDQWDRNSAPPPAPLPAYQRQYSGNRYPPAQQQPVIHTQNYHYQPSEPVVRQHYEQQGYSKQHTQQQSAPQQHPQQHQPEYQQQPQGGAAHGQSQAPASSQQGAPPQGKEAAKDSKGKGQQKGDEEGEDHGQGNDKGPPK